MLGGGGASILYISIFLMDNTDPVFARIILGLSGLGFLIGAITDIIDELRS